MDELKSNDGHLESRLDIRESVDVTERLHDQKLGNEHDQWGMVRMGKRQELRREFQFFSIWGFAVILGCSWEYVFVLVSVLMLAGSCESILIGHRQ